MFATIVLSMLLSASVAANPLTFAVIGDFGREGSNQQGVANLVKTWRPFEAVLTTGDNDYEADLENSVGQYWSEYMFPYRSTRYAGASDGVNRFYPCPGNHDWDDADLRSYLEFFAGVDRKYYYSKSFGGLVDFFFMDSNTDQTRLSGTSATSTQGKWLQSALSASTAPWKIVIQHHAPWCSGDKHGSNARMQWNTYHTWGAHAVLAGHDHSYERLVRPEGACSTFPFLINGLGGGSISGFDSPLPGSMVRFDKERGAQRLTVTPTTIAFEFVSVTNKSIDCFYLKKASNACGFTVHSCIGTGVPTTPIDVSPSPPPQPRAPLTSVVSPSPPPPPPQQPLPTSTPPPYCTPCPCMQPPPQPSPPPPPPQPQNPQPQPRSTQPWCNKKKRRGGV